MTGLRLESIELRYKQTEGSKNALKFASKGTSKCATINNVVPPFSLKSIDLALKEGEFFALLGPSGCGKTTLLKVIAGLLTPEMGEIYWASEKLTGVPAEKRGFGMVFQQPLLFPHMTVLDNVSFGLKMQGISKKERYAKAENLLTAVDLSGFAHHNPAQLSGGQQQRVALARALVSQPKVLLMDEPFSAMDPSLRFEMRELLATLHRKHKLTVLFVTHDRDEAFAMADRVGIMQSGALMQIDTPQELYEKPTTPEIARFLGIKNLLQGQISNGVFRTTKGQIELPMCGESRGWLILRPEILRISTERKHQNALLDGQTALGTGIVKNMVYRQGFYDLEVEVDGQVFYVLQRADEASNLAKNMWVSLSCESQNLQFIPIP